MNISINNEKINEYKDLLRQRLFSNRHYVKAGLGIARSITNFATNNNPLSFIEGGFNLLDGFSQLGNTTPQEFFSPERNWKVLVSTSWKNKPMFDIFSSVLEGYPYEVISYGGMTSLLQEDDKIYNFAFGQIGLCKNSIYFKSKLKSREEIWSWFLNEKIKKLDSKFYSLISKEIRLNQWDKITKFELCAEQPFAIGSNNSDYYTQYIKSYLDKNINRSFIFLGMPGTGKSTLIQTILKNTNLTSFRFRYNSFTTDLDSIQYLLKALKIDALILDDFDQGSNNAFLLEFLEWANRNIKLILASSNSLKEVHPAIIRPGRFAEVVEINQVDDTLLKSLLNDKYDLFKDQVKMWPVAYINELMTRIKVHNDLDTNILIKELNDRVEKALEKLKT